MEGQALNELPSDLSLSDRWVEAAKIAFPEARTGKEASGIFDEIKIRFRASHREMKATRRDEAYPSTKRCSNKRSRFNSYLKDVFGGGHKGDMTNVYVYLETGQLLLISPSRA